MKLPKDLQQKKKGKKKSKIFPGNKVEFSKLNDLP